VYGRNTTLLRIIFGSKGDNVTEINKNVPIMSFIMCSVQEKSLGISYMREKYKGRVAHVSKVIN
jgi:hypothetical protein